MAELTTKLHVKQNDTIYEVTAYDNMEEATPEGGSYLNIKNNNNGEIGYIPLWAKSISGGENHTPLSIIKDGIEYWLDTIVTAKITNTITLTNDYYKMSAIYPNNRTMTIVPDKLDSSSVTNMSYMFCYCAKLTKIPEFDTSNVINMYWMFNKCSSITTIPQLDTKKASNVEGMFSDCSKLITIPSLNMSSATNMRQMFINCTSLETTPILNTSSATNMQSMFYNCTSLKTMSELDTSNVTNMNYMFYNCLSLTDILELNTSKVSDMTNMFENCSSLPTTFPWIIDCAKVSSRNNMANMFKGSSVTKVTLKSVKSSIKSNVTSQLLKGDNTLTITFA